MSGEYIITNVPGKKNKILTLNSPNEEILLNFIRPITENNHRFYNLLLIDRLSEWLNVFVEQQTEKRP